MEAATLPDEQQTPDEGAPAEGAEATRENRNLFAYSQQVHVGAGADTCEHRGDGKCQEDGHFHAFVVLPNPLQHRDILDKARAARSRRKRAMRDAGDATRQPSDAFVSLEADLDDLLSSDKDRIMDEIADREVRRNAIKRIADVQEKDERFESYWQDREEFERLEDVPEDERPSEEYQALKRTMDDFEKAVEERTEGDRQVELNAMKGMGDEQFRERLRAVRIEGEAAEAHLNAFYTWMAFVGTRNLPQSKVSNRYFQSLDHYRNAPPEMVDAVDSAIRDLESRMQRGDAAGN